MIELERIRVTAGTFTVGELSLTVRGGTCTFLLGPSGAGKTLILETIAGIQSPTSGRVLIDGTDVTALPPERRRVGFVYQDYSLFPHYTVARNIGFGMRMHGKSRNDEDRMTRELLEMLGIPHLEGRFPMTLSGGEQQRVALARALAIDPTVLLLDEPFAALDPRSREECLQALARVRRERDITILQVSHSRDEAYRLADQVVLIDAGRILQAGQTDQVFSHPSGRKAALIAGYENILEADVVEARDQELVLDVNGTPVSVRGEVPAGSRIVIGIRAGSLHISRDDPGRDHGKNCIAGTILSQVCSEHTCQVTLSGTPGLTVVLPKEQAAQLGIQAGHRILVTFDPADVQILEQEGSA